MWARRLRWLGIGALAFAAGGCASTPMTHARYRLPLSTNPAGEDAARLCARRCEVTNDFDRAGLLACLRDCPGLEITEGAKCTSRSVDRAPIALCYTEARKVPAARDEDDEDSTAVDVLAAIIGTAIEIATAGDDDDHDEPDETDDVVEEEPGVMERANTARHDPTAERRPAEPRRRPGREPARPRRR